MAAHAMCPADCCSMQLTLCHARAHTKTQARCCTLAAATWTTRPQPRSGPSRRPLLPSGRRPRRAPGCGWNRATLGCPGLPRGRLLPRGAATRARLALCTVTCPRPSLPGLSPGMCLNRARQPAHQDFFCGVLKRARARPARAPSTDPHALVFYHLCLQARIPPGPRTAAAAVVPRQQSALALRRAHGAHNRALSGGTCPGSSCYLIAESDWLGSRFSTCMFMLLLVAVNSRCELSSAYAAHVLVRGRGGGNARVPSQQTRCVHATSYSVVVIHV